MTAPRAKAAAARRDEPAGTPARDKLGKLLRLRRTVQNWPRTLFDHLGLVRGDYVCRMRDGAIFEVRGGTDDRHVLFELFVEGIYPVGVRPGMVVIDIGAHIGGFTVWAARKGARVLAFEPFPANYGRLERNLQRNRLAEVEPSPVAVTGRRERREMFVPRERGHSGRYSLHPGRGADTFPVDCRSLGEILDEHRIESVDVLKLDCQGSEYEILYGAGADVLARVDVIAVECERFDTPPEWSLSALRAYLEECGFATSARGSVLLAERRASAGPVR
jgi:FkbM family methyltransferase